MAPAVSVVIPTHTGGPLVREAVASVRAQTFTDWEIVVVADGCDDPLDDLAADPRVTVIHLPHSGVSFARNVGFHASTGRYVNFLDHDDVMYPGKLAAQIACFTADPAVGMCHTQFEQVGPDLRFLVAGHGADIQYEDLLECRCSLLISTVLVSREAAVTAGLFDPKTKAEDIDFFLRVARSHRLAFVPDVLLKYRRHDGNISGDPWIQFREVDYVLRGFRRYLKGLGEATALPLIDRGRARNRRVNAEIAVLRARSADRHSAAGVAAVAKNLGIALVLSPGVVVGNARAKFGSAAA